MMSPGMYIIVHVNLDDVHHRIHQAFEDIDEWRLHPRHPDGFATCPRRNELEIGLARSLEDQLKEHFLQCGKKELVYQMECQQYYVEDVSRPEHPIRGLTCCCLLFARRGSSQTWHDTYL